MRYKAFNLKNYSFFFRERKNHFKNLKHLLNFEAKSENNNKNNIYLIKEIERVTKQIAFNGFAIQMYETSKVAAREKFGAVCSV